MKIAFVGLGVMGYPMAGHLAAAGHQLTVYNRSPEKAQAWCQAHPGELALTAREAAVGADFVMVCVGNDDDVRAAVLGQDGALTGMEPGAVLVDHTTTTAALAQTLYSHCGDAGIAFLDAPVSGGQVGAEQGCLTIMVGGDDAAFSLVAPVLGCYGKDVTLIGASGSGQKCKMVNQICAAVLIQGLAEGLNFASAAGLDVATVVKVIGGGAAQSWQLDNRGITMANNQFDFGFAVDWMHKDLQACLQEAARNGAPLPITRQVDQYYEVLKDKGFGRCDSSALIKLLRPEG